MSELYHWGIKGQRWGQRRYQNDDGSLTTAGRLRYGVGSAIRGGVFDSSNTMFKRAKRLGTFGSELTKAKAYSYANTGRYKFRQAKSGIARLARGKDANKQIERDNRRRQLDYKISRAQAQGFINHIAKSTSKSVFSASEERFKHRISVGQRYVDLTKRYVPRGAINKIKWDYIDATLPEIKIGKDSLRGLTRVRMG